MFWRKRKPVPSENPVLSDAAPLYPPQVHQFLRIEDWLVAWVSYRLEEKKGTYADRNINGTRCLGLIGSIGLDSAVAEDGTFFIQLGLEDDVSWQKASPQDRTWLIVCTQRRLYPEFSVLLPLRPASATDCLDCVGTGFVYDYTVACSSCNALGWVSGVEAFESLRNS